MIGGGAWRSRGVADVRGLGSLSCMHASADYYPGWSGPLMSQQPLTAVGRVVNNERQVPASVV
jgi:hypothetical protein